MRVARRLAALVFVCALVCGMIVFISCDSGDDDDDNNNDSGDDDDDNGSSDLPTYLNQRPELLSWSSWSSHFDHADPIPWTQLGGFGIGNGRVFSMLATVPPLTTLRNTAGPTTRSTYAFSRTWSSPCTKTTARSSGNRKAATA